MADLLGEMDNNIPSRRPALSSKSIKTENRRKVRVLSPPIEATPKPRSNKSTAAAALSTPPQDSWNDDEGYLPPLDDDVAMSDPAPAPSSPIAKAVERKGQTAIKVEEEDDDYMEISQAVGDNNIKRASINISGSRPAPKILKKANYPTPESSSPTRPTAEEVDPSAWNNVTSKLNVLSSPAQETTSFGKLKIEDATEDDGSVRMFWTDYTEVNGSLCLFGKVKDKTTGQYVSAFVKVDNILRKLYFLPREYRQSKLSVSLY